MISSERRRRLAWLMAGRAIITTLLLGSGVLIQINLPGSLPIYAFYFLIGLTFLLHGRLRARAAAGRALALARGSAARRRRRRHLGLHRASPAASPATSRCSTSCRSSPPARSLHRRGALTVAALSSLLYAALVVRPVRRPPERGRPWLVVAGRPAARPRGAATWSGSTSSRSWPSARCPGRSPSACASAGAKLESASTEIANLQAFNQDVIDSLTSGLVTTDITGRILSFNRAAETITGQPAASVIGRDVGEVLQLPDDVRRLLARDLDGARSRRADFLYPSAAGRPIEIGMAAAHLLTPGGKLGFLHHVPGHHRRSSASSATRASSSGWRRWARWRPASPTRSATRWPRWPARSRCCARS